MDCSTPGFPVHHQLPELTQTHVHWVGDAIQPSHPLSSPSPPAFNLSQHRVFCKESVLHNRWPKYWSFSFSISPSKEYSGLISFRIDWFDLLAVQGTQESSPTPQSKNSIYSFVGPGGGGSCPFWRSRNTSDFYMLILSSNFALSFTSFKCILWIISEFLSIILGNPWIQIVLFLLPNVDAIYFFFLPTCPGWNFQHNFKRSSEHSLPHLALDLRR